MFQLCGFYLEATLSLLFGLNKETPKKQEKKGTTGEHSRQDPKPGLSLVFRWGLWFRVSVQGLGFRVLVWA